MFVLLSISLSLYIYIYMFVLLLDIHANNDLVYKSRRGPGRGALRAKKRTFVSRILDKANNTNKLPKKLKPYN